MSYKACGQFTNYSPQMMRRIDRFSNRRAEAPMPRLAGLLLPLWARKRSAGMKCVILTLPEMRQVRATRVTVRSCPW